LGCRICNKAAIKDNYCKSHAKAYENLVEKYCQWKKALEVSWKEYLSEIVKNPFTGQWVKEVAQYLAENGES
jgi:hypothetical protein